MPVLGLAETVADLFAWHQRVMFVVELVLGLLAQSTGLVADSLEMFADAAIYGLAWVAVGRAASLKVRAAHLAGWLQVLLALGVLFAVGRRTLFGSEPVSGLMMAVGMLLFGYEWDLTKSPAGAHQWVAGNVKRG